jgi:hypothetical protein
VPSLRSRDLVCVLQCQAYGLVTVSVLCSAKLTISWRCLCSAVPSLRSRDLVCVLQCQAYDLVALSVVCSAKLTISWLCLCSAVPGLWSGDVCVLQCEAYDPVTLSVFCSARPVISWRLCSAVPGLWSRDVVCVLQCQAYNLVTLSVFCSAKPQRRVEEWTIVQCLLMQNMRWQNEAGLRPGRFTNMEKTTRREPLSVWTLRTSNISLTSFGSRTKIPRLPSP